MFPVRVLGHDGQVIARLSLDRPARVVYVPAPPKVRMAVEEPDLTALEPLTLEAEYERTDGGGTRIYRLRIDI